MLKDIRHLASCHTQIRQFHQNRGRFHRNHHHNHNHQRITPTNTHTPAPTPTLITSTPSPFASPPVPVICLLSALNLAKSACYHWLLASLIYLARRRQPPTHLRGRWRSDSTTPTRARAKQERASVVLYVEFGGQSSVFCQRIY